MPSKTARPRTSSSSTHEDSSPRSVADTGWRVHTDFTTAFARALTVDSPMVARGPPPLSGRDEERQLLDRLVNDVRDGRSAVVVIRGEAGVGKTALLHYCAGQASGFRIAQIAGVEAEMELPFAGVHQLCAPMLGRLDDLPGAAAGRPERRVRAVVGGRAGPLPRGPCCAEPVVGGRGGSGPCSVSSTTRSGWTAPLARCSDSSRDGCWRSRWRSCSPLASRVIRTSSTACRRCTSGGLDDGHARALLARALPGRLDDRVRDRILAETRGNPLALLELPQGMSAAELAGGFELPAAGDVPGHIEDHYLRRARALPEATQRLMLLAAADPVGDAGLVWRAAQALGIEASALAAAEDADLLEIGAQVRFRHPLVRSAAYRSATVEERRAVHLALAQATDPELDPDRRAWHLAAATAGPDEEVATELERSAGRARARGGLAAAAAFLQRAAALTGEPKRRTDRALAAADLGVRAGAFDAARGMMAAAEVGPLDELQRARLDLLRAEASYSESRGSAAPALLLRAAQTLEPLDRQLARETFLDAWSSALFAGGLAGSAGLHEVSREIRAGGGPADGMRPSDVLLDGFSLAFTDGRSAAAPVLERAAIGYAGEDVSVEEALRWGWLATAAAVMVWDYDTCLEVATRGVQLAREAGALAVLAVSVNVMAQAVALGGDFGRAKLLVAEADNVTEATGARVAPYGALVLGGLQGRDAHASSLIDATIDEFTAGGQGTAVQYARWARSVLLNGLGRYREAMAAAKEASDDTPELFVSVWAAIELLEAASRCDDAGAGARCARAHPGRHGSGPHRLGARDRRAVPGASKRGGGLRRPLPGGDRAARPHAATPGAGPRSPALRRVAPPREPSGRRACSAAGGPRAVHRDRDGGVRRARPGRAPGDRREGAEANGRDARRPHRAGVADRAARARRAVEPRDRCAALPEPAHGRMAPPQGVQQTRDPLPPGARKRAAQLRIRADVCLSSAVRKHLDDATTERSLEVAVDVQAKLLEPRGPGLLRGPPEQLEEIGQRRRELAVGGQRHLVHVCLRPRQRLVSKRASRAAIASTSSSSWSSAITG